MVPHEERHAGRASADKRREVGALIATTGADAAVLTQSDSIAWLLNIRGADVPHTPLPLSFAILEADGRARLFIDARKLAPEARAHLGNEVTVRPREALPHALDELRGKRVRIDAEATPVWFSDWLRQAGAEISTGEDPCRLPRACKNPAEREGAHAAHRRDGAAMARFLHWFAEEAPKGGLTEISAAAKLLDFRRALPLFRGESFPAISGVTSLPSHLLICAKLRFSSSEGG